MAKAHSRGQPKRRRTAFTLNAPEAHEVILMGDFNQWSAKTHPMKRGADRLWQKILMLDPGRYEYRFLVDGQWWHDPKNDQVCPNCFGTQNNVLVVRGK
jgi:1,4-alpha-glucan branching enzyme